MKASEKDIANLDNDYLASVLEKQIATDRCKCFVCNCVHEAANRLRKADCLYVDMIKSRDRWYHRAVDFEVENHKLRTKLKVAEDALLEIAENAFAAMREEGGVK